MRYLRNIHKTCQLKGGHEVLGLKTVDNNMLTTPERKTFLCSGSLRFWVKSEEFSVIFQFES